MRFGLEQTIIKNICRIFSKYENIDQVILYGSRAKGTHKDGSDIDITLKGNDLDLTTLNKVANDLDDLLLPYTFDISIYSQIKNQDLINHISRIGKIFFKK